MILTFFPQPFTWTCPLEDCNSAVHICTLPTQRFLITSDCIYYPDFLFSHIISKVKCIAEISISLYDKQIHFYNCQSF